MAITHGMNVAEVERIGRNLQQQSTKITDVITQVDVLMGQVKENWKGPDALKFDDAWVSTHKTALGKLRDQLVELGKQADREAKAQTTTSA